VQQIIAETSVIKGNTRRTLGWTVLHDAFDTQDTVGS
jgi:hypothetical protein